MITFEEYQFKVKHGSIGNNNSCHIETVKDLYDFLSGFDEKLILNIRFNNDVYAPNMLVSEKDNALIISSSEVFYAEDKNMNVGFFIRFIEHLEKENRGLKVIFNLKGNIRTCYSYIEATKINKLILNLE